MSLIRISLVKQIIVALILGVIFGVALGQYANIFHFIGKTYIMLVEAVIFPYIMSSLIYSIGRMSNTVAINLLKNSWPFYISLVVIIFLILFVLSFAIPESTTSFSLIQQTSQTSISLLDILIPQNIFTALSNNYVPAVIIFTILFGIATHLIPKKHAFLEVVNTISNICVRFWKMLIVLAPIAVFSLTASVAGTINLQQLASISLYLVLLFLGFLLIVLWLLPKLVAAMVPISYKRFLKEMFPILLITATTTISVLALPMIFQMTKKLLSENKKQDATSDEIIETMVLTSYPFSQIGSFFTYLFIIFVSFYFHQIIPLSKQIILPLMTYLSTIGTPTTSINCIQFLSGWLDLSQQGTSLYVSIFSFTQFLMIPMSVMAIAFLTITISFSYYKLIKINYRKLIIALVIPFLICAGFSYITIKYFPNFNTQVYQKLKSFRISPVTTSGVKYEVIPFSKVKQIKGSSSQMDSLSKIRLSKVLRVGYNPTSIPFAFFNNDNQLVGFDIAYAFKLAKSLDAKLIFVPFEWPNVIKDLNENKFDIVMSGAYVTSDRIQKSFMTQPYFKSPVVLITKKSNKTKFSKLENIKNADNITISADIPLLNYAKEAFPNANITMYPSIAALGNALLNNETDIVISSRAQAALWVANHKNYTVFTPKGLQHEILTAYMINRHSPQLVNYVNYWMQLQDGYDFRQKVFYHWILAEPNYTIKRWSLWNVLFN